MTIDPNSVSAAVISDLIKSSFDGLTRGASTFFGTSYRKIFEDFAPYMNEVYRKNRKVRILCQKERDVDLYEAYVSSNFQSRDNKISDDELIVWINEGNNAVINGNGGAGKTFFMRHFWLTLFLNDFAKTPIFLELRKLNEIQKSDISTFIRLSISKKRELSDNLFKYFCETGRFCFLLDGFDELLIDQRELVQGQILEMSAMYPGCQFVVSSRYESRFAGWQNFTVFESVPFDLPQVRNLIEKVPFDPEAKKLFVKQLTGDFFRQHESFLSNPLLAIMMMMTFRENMNIPKRMANFYDQAFNTLYQWHDATKAYSRKKNLDIDEFQRSFSIFCMISYYQQKYEFTRTEILEFIRKSNKICGIHISPEKSLSDYEEAVNLIRQDGLIYVFIHRSFQEYFASLALVRILPEKFSEMVPAIASRTDDSVIAMCFEINPALVTSEYITPNYSKECSSGVFSREYRMEPFGAIEAIGGGYVYTLWEVSPAERRKSKGSPPDWTRVSIRVLGADGGNFDFLDQVARITSTRRGRLNGIGYLEEILIEGDVFSLFRDIRGPLGGQIEVEIRFSAGELKIDVRRDKGTLEISNSLRNAVAKNIADNMEVFASLNRNLIEALGAIETWCDNAIKTRKKMGRSLDEILEL